MFNISASLLNEERSKYFSDIIDAKLNKKEKSLLLNWQEEYLTRGFEEAKKYIDKARVEIGITSSQVYEYSLITYVQLPVFTEKMRDYISGNDVPLVEKVLLFFERAQFFDDKSTSNNDSIVFAQKTVLDAIRNTYQNISYDYVSYRGTRSIKKKRELVNRCISITIKLRNKISDDNKQFHPVFEDLLLEILGGDKYLWLAWVSGELREFSSASIIDYFKKIESIVQEEYTDQYARTVGEYLFSSLSSKVLLLESARFRDRAKRKLVIAAKLGAELFKDDRFNKLIVHIKSDRNLEDHLGLTEKLVDNDGSDEAISLNEAYADAVEGLELATGLAGTINNDGDKLSSVTEQAPIKSSISSERDNNLLNRYLLYFALGLVICQIFIGLFVPVNVYFMALYESGW